MTALKVGDRIKDNDPRMDGRVLVVISIEGNRVFAKHPHGGYVSRFQLRRIHTDGKARKSGLSLVLSPAAASTPPSSSDEQGKVGKGVTP